MRYLQREFPELFPISSGLIFHTISLFKRTCDVSILSLAPFLSNLSLLRSFKRDEMLLLKRDLHYSFFFFFFYHVTFSV